MNSLDTPNAVPGIPDASPAQQPSGDRAGAAAPVDFRLLFEQFPGLVMILLPDAPHYTIATCSDAYLAATLTSRAIFGRSLFEVFPDNPDDPTADGVRNLRASLEHVLAHREAHTMALQKYDVARPDGSGFQEKWWSPVNTPALVDGRVRYIIHHVADVTDEVLLQRERQRQENLLSTLVEALPSAVIVTDLEGSVLVNNPAAEAITGLAAQAIPAVPTLWPQLLGMHSPSGEPLTIDDTPLGRALKGEAVKEQELLIRNAHNHDGVHVTAAARPLRDVTGHQIGALTVLTDISERVVAERELAARADALGRARIATQAARIAPFTWYVARDAVELDPLGRQLQGLGPGEGLLTLEAFLSGVHPDDGIALRSNLHSAVAERRREFQLEYRTVSETGRLRWIRVAGAVGEFDGVLRATGALLDVTIEIEVQRALEARTRETERANAELDEFTYIASHDLKEPLRGIHNYARFLAEDYADKLDAGGQQMLTALGQQAGRMQRLIEDLLEIARLGREPMKQADTDLDAVLGEVLDSLQFSLAEKKVDVRRQPLGHFICDRVRIGEVFRNLITNALKYNDKSAPVIEIGRAFNAAGETEFSVRDNGIGIKPEYHARIFAPFKRLHSKDAYGGGSGVGLAIVKRIVEAHGGHIEVHSEPGAGTTFTFTLSGDPYRD